jgi:uncharacterized protein (DUF2236 family)
VSRLPSAAERVNGERGVLAGWSRAILLQLAHPLIAAGVAEHSSVRASPATAVSRLHQTVRAMLGLTFGDAARRDRTIEQIREIHRRVNGTLAVGVGPFPAGTRYSAEDPDLLVWVHATLLDSTVLAYEGLGGALTAADRDAYCRDSADVAIALGARPDDVPRDWSALGRYVEAMVASDTLTVGDEARAVASAVLGGRLAVLTGPVAWGNRLLTTGWLPERIRAQYDLRWTSRDERRFGRLLVWMRRTRPWMPRAIAIWPEARRR